MNIINNSANKTYDKFKDKIHNDIYISQWLAVHNISIEYFDQIIDKIKKQCTIIEHELENSPNELNNFRKSQSNFIDTLYSNLKENKTIKPSQWEQMISSLDNKEKNLFRLTFNLCPTEFRVASGAMKYKNSGKMDELYISAKERILGGIEGVDIDKVNSNQLESLANYAVNLTVPASTKIDKPDYNVYRNKNNTPEFRTYLETCESTIIKMRQYNENVETINRFYDETTTFIKKYQNNKAIVHSLLPNGQNKIKQSFKLRHSVEKATSQVTHIASDEQMIQRLINAKHSNGEDSSAKYIQQTYNVAVCLNEMKKNGFHKQKSGLKKEKYDGVTEAAKSLNIDTTQDIIIIPNNINSISNNDAQIKLTNYKNAMTKKSGNKKSTLETISIQRHPIFDSIRSFFKRDKSSKLTSTEKLLIKDNNFLFVSSSNTSQKSETAFEI